MLIYEYFRGIFSRFLCFFPNSRTLTRIVVCFTQEESTGRWVADTGRQILTDLLLLGDKDPKDFLVGYEAMLEFLQEQNNWPAIEKELEARNVKAMTFYDVVSDFIIVDAFNDLDSPPASVIAVVNNRFLSNGFKETVKSPFLCHIRTNTTVDGLRIFRS